MKYIILILSIFLVSCNRHREKPYIIDGKIYLKPIGICRYSYNIEFAFEDSCNKYSVGDTIK